VWGPGSYANATAWFAECPTRTDRVEYLDRWFLIRIHNGRSEEPRSPAGAAHVEVAEREGNWYLMRADFPNDAFTHVRYEHEPFLGECEECAADGVHVGSWAEILDVLCARGWADEGQPRFCAAPHWDPFPQGEATA
jgi:hypothetical protein